MLRLSAIGDVCHCLPILRTLQATWPDTKITWVIGQTESKLISKIEGVELIILNKKGGPAAKNNLKQQLNQHDFDVLLMLQASIRSSLIARHIKSDIRIGFDRNRARDFQWLFSTHKISAHPEQHVVDGLFCFLEELGIDQRVEGGGNPHIGGKPGVCQ